MTKHDLTEAQYLELMTGKPHDASPLSQVQVAEVSNLSTRRLRQVDESGEGPTRDSSGKYPVLEFRAWLLGKWSEGVFIDEGGRGHLYEAERARLMHWLADEAAQKETDLRARLIDTKDAAAEWEKIKASARAAFQPLPAKLAAACANKPAGAVEMAARKIVYSALNELARREAENE